MIYNIGVLHTCDRHKNTISVADWCILKRPDVVTFDDSSFDGLLAQGLVFGQQTAKHWYSLIFEQKKASCLV